MSSYSRHFLSSVNPACGPVPSSDLNRNQPKQAVLDVLCVSKRWPTASPPRCVACNRNALALAEPPRPATQGGVLALPCGLRFRRYRCNALTSFSSSRRPLSWDCLWFLPAFSNPRYREGAWSTGRLTSAIRPIGVRARPIHRIRRGGVLRVAGEGATRFFFHAGAESRIEQSTPSAGHPVANEEASSTASPRAGGAAYPAAG